ncbi:MAG: hypothetical protein CBARDMAM_2154 [uncultured Caballeronia sp.]|nr:MAG: hypothetical protein CBARDMAM_2154 [uncultured Caballeronia sp.]
MQRRVSAPPTALCIMRLPDTKFQTRTTFLSTKAGRRLVKVPFDRHGEHDAQSA